METIKTEDTILLKSVEAIENTFKKFKEPPKTDSQEHDLQHYDYPQYHTQRITRLKKELAQLTESLKIADAAVELEDQLVYNLTKACISQLRAIIRQEEGLDDKKREAVRQMEFLINMLSEFQGLKGFEEAYRKRNKYELEKLNGVFESRSNSILSLCANLKKELKKTGDTKKALDIYSNKLRKAIGTLEEESAPKKGWVFWR